MVHFDGPYNGRYPEGTPSVIDHMWARLFVSTIINYIKWKNCQARGAGRYVIRILTEERITLHFIGKKEGLQILTAKGLTSLIVNGRTKAWTN